jgi:alpha-N-arabinofuranosidase
MDNFIEEVVAIADAVAARRRSPSASCCRSTNGTSGTHAPQPKERVKSGWPVAPRFSKSLQHAGRAHFGGACISLLNHADRVKVGCLAQLVNVIAPIMTETGGPAWRQTIFYPFADFSNLGRGNVLRATVD